jgi:DNA polymerase-1
MVRVNTLVPPPPLGLPRPPITDLEDLCVQLNTAGLGRGAFLSLVLAGDAEVGLCAPAHAWSGSLSGVRHSELAARVEAEFRPRWIWWSNDTAADLIADGVRVATCWDLAAVHRVLFGGWRTDPARIWASLAGLDEASLPATGQLELLTDPGDDGGNLSEPCRPDGHLRPEWLTGGWRRSADRWATWAEVAAQACGLQQQRLRGDPSPERARRRIATAQSESAADLLCAELGHDGLPVDRTRAEAIIGTYAGPRPESAEQAVARRTERDDAVRAHVPGVDVDLRSPTQVRALLARVGIELPDTRSWRMELFRGAHPVVEALLSWRKDERFATTYGYDWLDRQLGADGRLRGSWTGCDGGAGRMTASAGLHSMPAELRDSVSAEDGYRLVRADLGQIEPRVLAAVSGDRALASATAEQDLYAPVAATLGVERSVAKVAVLAAMYGQTSGAAGEALKGLESAYPVAMRYLRQAYEAGRDGRDIHTFGGRLVRMWPIAAGRAAADERAAVASRGRYARNAVIQGAAAEFFKAWAVTVRARCRPLGAQIVLCLHDELLVHAPQADAEQVAQLLESCLGEVAGRWAPPGSKVRFVADVSVIERWSQAKA